MGVCKCSGCGKVFLSVFGFDRHRAGEYTTKQRHCLTTEQMQAKGYVLNNRSQWITEHRIKV